MRRCIAIVTAGLLLQACMHWGTKKLEPEQFDGGAHDRRVRVTLADGEILIVKNPFISGDSLVWLRAVSRDTPDSVHRQGVPLQRRRVRRTTRSDGRQRSSCRSTAARSPAGKRTRSLSNPLPSARLRRDGRPRFFRDGIRRR